MKEHIQTARDRSATQRWSFGVFLLAPASAFAQTSPFDTGANGLVSFAMTIGTPIAVLIIIGLAIAAAVGKMSWGWVIGAIVGIAAIFGSQQIVAWIRSMFGV